jgi:hypothetical protein
MTDQELRAMIRESIARHAAPDAVRPSLDAPGPSMHPSHMRLPLRSGDEDGACVIEPAVRCNHCGYCLSLGH